MLIKLTDAEQRLHMWLVSKGTGHHRTTNHVESVAIELYDPSEIVACEEYTLFWSTTYQVHALIDI